MNTLVTGATGFIGANLALHLAEEGQVVHALCRSEPDPELIDHPRIRIFRGNIMRREDLMESMMGCDQVYHLAAYARLWAENPLDIYKVNIGGMMKVMECALEAGIQKVVYTSTAGIFGPSNHEPTNEEHVRQFPFYFDYEASKFIADGVIRNYIGKGLDVVTVYPTRVFGPGLLSQANSLSTLISAYIRGKWHVIPGDGNVSVNYVYVGDVVEGHVLAMKKGKMGERYILGGSNANYHEFFNIISDVIGKKYRLYKIPYKLINLYAYGELFRSRLLLREPKVTPQWVRSLRYDLNRSSEKAIKELGYQITPLAEGIKKTVEWLSNH